MPLTTIGRRAGSWRLVHLLRAQSRRLRWLVLRLLAPPDRKIPPPPWPLAPSVPAQVVARFPAPPEAVVRPAVYGDLPPPSGLADLPAEVALPTLELNRVEDVVLLGRHLFMSRRTGEMLPQSFAGDIVERSHLDRTGLMQSPPALGGPVAFTPTVFVADNRWDEFGHHLIEVLPQLAMAAHAPPDARIATSMRLRPHLMAMSGALGIDPDRWLRFEGAMICGEAYLPDLPVMLYHYVHPLAREAFERVGRLGRGQVASPPERIFLSRAGQSRRRLVNEAEIEALFAQRGFTIIRPEEHPFETQIALVAGARFIAGPSGSAMHLAAFARPDARVLMLCSDRFYRVVDTLFHGAPGRLGYVFGAALDPQGRGMTTDWQLDVHSAAAGIKGHFGLAG